MQNYNDEMIDVAIKYAGHELLADAACIDNWTEPSALFDSRMRALIRGKAAQCQAKAALKIAARVAAILAIVLIISTAVIYSSEALRVQVMNMFLIEKEGQTEITFSNTDGIESPDGMVEPKFVPVGFELIETQVEGDGIIIMSLYQNEAGGYIRIQQLPLSSSIGVDNENAYETEIGGRTAYVSGRGDESTVVFNNDWNCFIITGSAPAEDLIAVAQSMLE